MAAGLLRGPANIRGGCLLDLTILLSGEERDIMLGELAQEESDKEEEL